MEFLFLFYSSYKKLFVLTMTELRVFGELLMFNKYSEIFSLIKFKVGRTCEKNFW